MSCAANVLKKFFLCCCVKMACRFEDNALVTVFEVNTDEWLKEVQVRSGQNLNCPCDFCSPGNDDKPWKGAKIGF